MKYNQLPHVLEHNKKQAAKHESETIASLRVDNAALTARVKELEEALIKAESALTYANWDGAFDENHTAQDVINARDAARAALRGEA